MFNMVVLPQPECPIRHTNSPASTEKWMFSNTVVPPPCPGKRLAMPSTLMRGSLIGERPSWVMGHASCALFRERNEAGQAGEDLVEQHADQADREDAGEDVGDR